MSLVQLFKVCSLNGYVVQGRRILNKFKKYVGKCFKIIIFQGLFKYINFCPVA